MDFAAALDAIEEMRGIEVQVGFWGRGEGASLMGTLQGELTSRHETQSMADLDLPAHVRDAIGEVAETFPIAGHWGNVLTLWRSRFVSARRTETWAGVEITTLDGKITIWPNRPGID